ncbi:MAG: RES domain-containing protein [Cupriavidus sp.]|nr:RES domain-containing protein [Cupriavidus sp.]
MCCQCLEDPHLRTYVLEHGEVLECSECGESDQVAITLEQLGKLMEPIMRENFMLGEAYKVFDGDDDRGRWMQTGEDIENLVQEVLGQYVSINGAIAEAVVDAEEYWPSRGEEAFWDPTSNYVPRPSGTEFYHSQWDNTLTELKYGRRFFSPAARRLFKKLFADVEGLRARAGTRTRPVVRRLPVGTSLYRARVCNSKADLDAAFAAPFTRVGPPPKEMARAGRMNAEGVVVFYGATEPETARAELRPALQSDILQIVVQTTAPLRILDFSRLEAARSSLRLSYFQSNYREELERSRFLQFLHALISRPIVPGHEADYLITQTMAEYLAHVHEASFDGIVFSSAQRAGGTNVVLFSDPTLLTGSVEDAFHIRYVDSSIRLFSTTAIKYTHREVEVRVNPDSGAPLALDQIIGLNEDF